MIKLLLLLTLTSAACLVTAEQSPCRLDSKLASQTQTYPSAAWTKTPLENNLVIHKKSLAPLASLPLADGFTQTMWSISKKIGCYTPLSNTRRSNA